MSAPIHRVIVGTAGHIDHGKSTLVRVLTGIDPDRLKEEKDRGMTIDLGFAPYRTESSRTVGIIDVPGHERFVKNMVAGASSVDVFLLVVAADDGVMPQTREHMEILDLLGARRGLVAVTKIDLVGEDLRELAVAEIEEVLAETPFKETPLVPVSSTTGEGIDALKRRLDALVDATEARTVEGLFRMPVQRVFSSKGHGTVVTGVPVSGRVAVGDVVEVLPGGHTGKVRGIQAYKEGRDEASAGHSTALNVSDLDHREVTRGSVVATPGFFKPVRFLEGSLRYLASAERPLKHGTDVRLHVGTSESIARVVLLDRPVLAPGEEAPIQLRLREPVVAAHGDRFLLRRISPMVTLGGGVLVSESERRTAGTRDRVAEGVAAKIEVLDDDAGWLERSLAERGAKPTPIRDACVLAKLPPDRGREVLRALEEAGRVRSLPKERVVHREAFDAASAAVTSELDRSHARSPLAAWARAGDVRKAAGLDEALFDGVLARLEEDGAVDVAKGGRIRRRGHVPSLDARDERALAAIEEALRAGGLKPPSRDELVRAAGLPAERVAALLSLLAEEGKLFSAAEVCFHASVLDRVRDVLASVAGRHGGELVVPEVRDELGTTRKFLIPLLEALDSLGLTVRRGDKRYLVERAAEAAE
ncbi:MAG: selenocysteine-specific translation elongation factor [Planctomycetota bacterium JB042]